MCLEKDVPHKTGILIINGRKAVCMLKNTLAALVLLGPEDGARLLQALHTVTSKFIAPKITTQLEQRQL